MMHSLARAGLAENAPSASALTVARAVREALRKLIHVPFRFEFSGSQIIFFDVEADYSAEEKAREIQSIEAFRELA